MKRLIAPLTALALLSPCVASAALTDGLLAHWMFNGTGGDQSGNGNAVSLFGGASFGAGVEGSALYLDGTSGYARATSPIGNLGTDATLAFWFNPDATNFLGEARVFEKDDRAYWIFTLNTTGLVASVHGENSYTGPRWDLFGGTPQSFAGKWSAVALRKTGSSFDLFMNGSLVASANTSITTISTTAPLNFGNSSFWGTGFYKGAVDETMVYNRALSNAEIGTLAAVPEPRTYAMLLAGLLALSIRQKLRSLL